MTWQIYQQLLNFADEASFAVWDPNCQPIAWPNDAVQFAQFNGGTVLKQSVMILGINRVGNSLQPWDNFHFLTLADATLREHFTPPSPLAFCAGSYITDLLSGVRGAHINYHHITDDTLRLSARRLELQMQVLGFDRCHPRFIILLGPTSRWWLRRLIRRANLQLPGIVNITEIFHPSPEARKTKVERNERVTNVAANIQQVLTANGVPDIV